MTDIGQWLEQHGLGKYADVFVENDVNLDVLPRLTEEHLKQLGVSLGHRIRMLEAVESLAASPGSTGRATSSPPIEAQAPRTYTPRHLAQKILDARSALEGERKLVTILFADIKGSTELIEHFDAEQAHQLLDPALQRMMDAVHRYEGTVNRVQGDGLMAMFGAPIAHEDHAMRACYAALAMQKAVRADGAIDQGGSGVQIRVGLHSGEVVVRAINNDLSMNYDAAGMTAHLAARMEQHAGPGGICLTAETARLAEGFIEVEAQGPVAVKGVSTPIELFTLHGATATLTRWQVALARGLTPFAGREAALETLSATLGQAARGHGQLAAIVGDAGIGKSRLVHEFIRSPTTRGWQVLAGHSVSYGKASDWLPVSYLLNGYFGITDDDTPGELADKVAVKLAHFDAALHAEVPAFLALLDVSVDDPGWIAFGAVQRRRRTLNALQALFVQESRRQPLLLVFEDLHWIDGETQTLIDELVELLPSYPILLLVDYRPEYAHGWGNRSYYSQLRLDPLAGTGAQSLLHELMGDSFQPVMEALCQEFRVVTFDPYRYTQAQRSASR